MSLKPSVGSILLCGISFLFAAPVYINRAPQNESLCVQPDSDQPKNVHYVSITGSDNDRGDINHPWLTIQHADSLARPGDTVIVFDGIYRGDISLASSGTFDKPIRYEAQNKWKARLIGKGFGAGSAVVGMSGGFIIFKGFDITGTDANGIILATYGSIAHNNQAVENYVHDLVVPCNSDSGTAIETGAGDDYTGISHNDMLNNLVVNITPMGGCEGGHQASGLFAEVPGSVIANNTVINAGYGIQSWHAASNLLIYGNTLVNNLRSITVGAGDAPYGRINDHTVVQGNVIFNSAEFAIAETGRTGLHNQYMDNLIWAGSTRVSLNHGLHPARTINADPMFLNNTGEASGNYELSSRSPMHRGRMARLWTSSALAAAVVETAGKVPISSSRVVPMAGIKSSATRIAKGKSAVLSWTTKNATEAMLNDLPVALNGSLNVSPTDSQVYKLVAVSPSGLEDWGSVSIDVFH